MVTDDPTVHERVMREVFRHISEMHLDHSPAAMGRTIHRIIREATGCDDPYRELKRASNEFALAIYPRLKQTVAGSDDPFATAIRLAVAGNLIDYGVNRHLDLDKVALAIEAAVEEPIDSASIEELRGAVARASDILYIGDNAGEIVFDRLLIEQMPTERVTFAVRGRPIVNDATMEDASAVGLCDLVEVIDNGDDAPGTIIETCSPAFRDRFERASLVIAKGQGNYETLSHAQREVFFILKVKCSVVARDLGCEVGATVVKRKRARAPAGQEGAPT